MHRHLGGQFPYAAFFWPALAAVAAAEAASSAVADFWRHDGECTAQEPKGATPSRIALELHSVRLRDFTVAKSGVPTLLCTPLALHGAAVADLAAGHSLVAALRGAGIERLFMADWRSASPEMRFLGIDDYLADLNVLVDQIGGLVDLVGLCQGGWLSLVYAGRFPDKVRKLVMAGAPIDVAARQSRLSAIAEATPITLFQSLVDLGGGRVIGHDVAKFWDNPAVRCRRLCRPGRQNSRGSRRSSRNGIPGPSMFPAATTSKLSRDYTSAMNSPPEGSSRWDKTSISRACGFQFIFLPRVPTKWLPRNNCWRWSGW